MQQSLIISYCSALLIIILSFNCCAQAYVNEADSEIIAYESHIARRSGQPFGDKSSPSQGQIRRLRSNSPEHSGSPKRKVPKLESDASIASSARQTAVARPSVSRSDQDQRQSDAVLSPPTQTNQNEARPGTRQSRSPSPHKTESSSWDGHGFTTSGSPSSWSKSSESPICRPGVVVQTTGHAVMRTRTQKSQSRRFEIVPSGRPGRVAITDSAIAQGAVYVRDQAQAGKITAIGSNVKVTVDARNSAQGGWVGKINRYGQHYSGMNVLPGTKVHYRPEGCDVGDGAKAFLRGKGTVKIHCSNTFSDDDSGSESVSSPDSSSASDSYPSS